MRDGLGYSVDWKLTKYADDAAVRRAEPYAVSEFRGNIGVNAGMNLMLTLLCGGAGTAFSAANACIGVGSSSTAAAADQTDLQGASKTRLPMDVSYPTYGTAQQAVWKATADGSTANHDWSEFGIFNASSSGTMLNRKVSVQGTKGSGQTWEIELTITMA